MYAPEALPIPAPKPPSSVHKYQGGLNRVHGTKRLGRPPMSDAKIEQIKRALISGRGIRATAARRRRARPRSCGSPGRSRLNRTVRRWWRCDWRSRDYRRLLTHLFRRTGRPVGPVAAFSPHYRGPACAAAAPQPSPASAPDAPQGCGVFRFGRGRPRPGRCMSSSPASSTGTSSTMPNPCSVR